MLSASPLTHELRMCMAFDFEKVRDETHSGEDTTNGRNVRLEMEFIASNELQLVDHTGAVINDADGNPLIIRREVAPNNCIVYIYQHFTRMINISNKGIAVTE